MACVHSLNSQLDQSIGGMQNFLLVFHPLFFDLAFAVDFFLAKSVSFVVLTVFWPKRLFQFVPYFLSHGF